MRRRAILSLAAACLLAACAHQDAARAPGMTWLLSETPEEGAKLAYGQPQSDNLALLMSCRPGSGQVLVARTAPEGAAPVIALASGGREARLAGEAAPLGGAPGSYVEATMPLAHPMLAAFQRTGDLALGGGGERTALPADKAAQGRIRAFFDACGAA